VRSTDLQDFFARVVVLPEGRLNLQNLVKNDSAKADPQSVDAVVATEKSVNSDEVSQPVTSPRIDMGPIALRGGVIKFSDYFIQPNYSADLTSLNGSLDAFSSQPPAPGEAVALAQLKLDGIAQGTAQLSI